MKDLLVVLNLIGELNHVSPGFACLAKRRGATQGEGAKHNYMRQSVADSKYFFSAPFQGVGGQ